MNMFVKLYALLFFLVPIFSFGNNNSTNTNTFSEDQKIEILIESLKKLPGAQFYKDGKYCDMNEASAFLKKKKNATSPKIRSAQEFIDKVASGSGKGNDYKIKFSNGNEMLAKDYFHNVLNEL